MKTYQYKARDNRGALIKGKMDVLSSVNVANHLLSRGLTPINIAEYTWSSGFFSWCTEKLELNKVESNDLMVFCRQMHVLLASSIPVVNALTYLSESTKSKKLKSCLNSIINNVASGQNLTQSFAKYPEVFAPIFTSIIDAGENSGKLDLAFLHISEHLEFELNSSRQITSVMRYPIIVITMAIAAIMVINFMVVPAFAKLFASFKAELPLPTIILIATSNFLVNNWLYLLLFITAAIIAINWYLKTEYGRLVWDKYKTKLPIMGEIITQIILARFARIFAMMIKSGVPIARSLVLVSNVVDNMYIRNGIMFIHNGVEHGFSISKTAAEAHLFPPMIIQMLNVGEETGSLDYLLLEIAKYYEDEIQYSLGRLYETIQPILLIFMGGLILVLAMGVFLPMWDMIGMIR
jgi:MSHA biogenesis protein MshG